MVTTRANSRETTPAASVRGTTYSERLRTSARRSDSAVTDGGATPSGRSRAKKSGPAAAPRTGNTSHAYGVASHATASRVASRTQQGFASALDENLIEQEPEISGLAPVAEEERNSSRASTPNSNPSSSSSISPKDAAIDGKSFSTRREDGLRVHPNSERTDDDDEVYPLLYERILRAVEPQPSVFERIATAAFTFGDGFKAFFNDYWMLLFGLLASLTFGSLLAILGVPSVGHLFSSSTSAASSPGYPPADISHVTTTVISYHSKPSDRAITSRLNHLESRISFLEDELARSRATISLLQPPFNHISASIGTTILPGHTSPTKRTISSWLIPLSKLWSPPGMKGPLTALQSWSEPGQCWCTPTDRAALGVRAPYPVKASAITIEHVLPDDLVGAGADTGSAPSLVEVWARGGEEEGVDSRGECLGAPPEKRTGWSCLSRLEITHNVRDVRSWTMDLTVGDVIAQDFVFSVLENAGNKEATCLYRVQLHGTRM
jgi:hypothetical protein